MRGSLYLRLLIFARPGIIPAHAGLTFQAVPDKHPSWDHPRACGAHHEVSKGDYPMEGSSPRMRGSPSNAILAELNTGDHPRACGAHPLHTLNGLDNRDHPRACGAHIFFSIIFRLILGSSPRMRGSLIVLVILVIVEGIIPAHAGLTEGDLHPSSG